jgi:hypothetical protein
MVRAALLSQAGQRELAHREYWALPPLILAGSIPLAFFSPTLAEYSWLLLLLLPATRRAQRP